MNGAADMGGMHGFGPVEIEPDEPVFHADWERRIFALNNAVGASEVWSLDAFRQARESIPPPKYLALSYYGLWVVTLENLMIEHGLATREEIATGRPAQAGGMTTSSRKSSSSYDQIGHQDRALGLGPVESRRSPGNAADPRANDHRLG